MPDYDQIAQAYLKRFQKPAADVLTEEYLGEEILQESRLDWLKKNTKPTFAKDHEGKDTDQDITFAHDPHGPVKSIPELVDHIAKHGDPTPNKVHTQWLVNIYKKGNLKQEDLPRAHAVLTAYEGTPASRNAAGERVEGVKGMKHSMSAEERVINHNKYPTVQSLHQAMYSKGGLPASKISENITKWESSGRGGHEQKYDDEHIRIYKLHSTPEGKEASKAIYGGGVDKGGTEWCTANHNDAHNHFDNYLHEWHPGSSLFVIHRKSDGAVYQYHPHSDQFMDKNDETIKHEDLKTILPSLHKAWDAHPELTDDPKLAK